MKELSSCNRDPISRYFGPLSKAKQHYTRQGSFEIFPMNNMVFVDVSLMTYVKGTSKSISTDSSISGTPLDIIPPIVAATASTPVSFISNFAPCLTNHRYASFCSTISLRPCSSSTTLVSPRSISWSKISFLNSDIKRGTDIVTQASLDS